MIQKSVGFLLSVTVAMQAQAAVVPYVEEFSSDSANWYNSASSAPVAWSMSGGPDGSSYATTTFNFQSSSPGATPALFRAQDKFTSSGGAFEGNWITDNVQRFQIYVRHDAGVDVTFFARFAEPANFPGAVAVLPKTVPSGAWTPLSIPMPYAGLVFEGPQTYADLFDNIGHVQIGVVAPEPLIGVNQVVTFDLDKVTILDNIPAASTWGLVALGIATCIAGTLMLRREGTGTLCIGRK